MTLNSDEGNSNKQEGKSITEESADNCLNITTYYLDQNLDNLKHEIQFTNHMHIQYSNNFPNQEYEKFFNIYYDNFKEKNHDQTYDEILKEIKQDYPNFCTDINNLKISNTTVDIDHICTKCQICVHSKSQLNSQYSIFLPQETLDQEYSILISDESKGIFKNCHFCNNSNLFVFVDDFSTVIFDHCIFENNHISCFSASGSKITFIDCKFKNDKYISIFLKLSFCELYNSEFFGHEGKAIFSKDSSEIYITKSRFINCKKGVATIIDRSVLVLDGQISIENCDNTSLRAVGNSEIKGHDLTIKNINGNAINLEDSSGCFLNTKISSVFHPTIASLGNNSNPIFQNCELFDNGNTFCVICKNGSRPLYDHCKFFECETNCFSVTDFSRPHIQNCYFSKIDRFYLNIFGGSYVTYDNIESDDKSIEIESKINSLKSAKCERKSLNDDDFEQEDVCSNEYKWIKVPEIFKTINLKHLKRMSVFNMIKETENKESLLKCSICHKEMCENDNPSMIIPCGHLICRNCIGIKRCPLCNSPVLNIQKLFLENNCAICLDKKPNTIALPCGHVCMCFECAMQNVSKGFNCPMCNKSTNLYKFNFDDIK